MVVACHHVACVVTEKNLKRKIIIYDWDCFSKLGKKSPNFHWDRGQEFQPM